MADSSSQTEKERYKSDEEELSIFEAKEMEESMWKKNMSAEFIEHEHWHIMYIIQYSTVSLAYITRMYNPTSKEFTGIDARDSVSKILQEMIDPEVGLITRTKGHKGKYSLTEKAKKMFTFDSDKIGTAPGINEAVRTVTRYYLNKGYFLAIADQKVKKDVYRTDMVAYDYNAKTPISVEIESEMEMNSHSEHVKLNMVKWPNLGFKKCHVWSYSRDLEELYDGLPDGAIKNDITIFIMDRETDEMRIIPHEPEADGKDGAGRGDGRTGINDGRPEDDACQTDAAVQKGAASGPGDAVHDDAAQHDTPQNAQGRPMVPNPWTVGIQPPDAVSYGARQDDSVPHEGAPDDAGPSDTQSGDGRTDVKKQGAA